VFGDRGAERPPEGFGDLQHNTLQERWVPFLLKGVEKRGCHRGWHPLRPPPGGGTPSDPLQGVAPPSDPLQGVAPPSDPHL